MTEGRANNRLFTFSLEEFGIGFVVPEFGGNPGAGIGSSSTFLRDFEAAFHVLVAAWISAIQSSPTFFFSAIKKYLALGLSVEEVEMQKVSLESPNTGGPGSMEVMSSRGIFSLNLKSSLSFDFFFECALVYIS